MSRIAFAQTGFLTSGQASLNHPMNGWFWPDPPQAVGTPILHITPQEAFDLFWRIKKLRVFGEYNSDPPFGPDTPFNFTTSIGFATSGVAYSSEQQLLVPRFVTGPGTGWDDAASGASFELTISNLWPRLADSMVGIILDMRAGGAGTTDPFSFGVPSALVATFLGYSVPTWFISGGTTGTVTAEIAEYWTYDGIYDATTGAQLITPLPRGL